MNIDCRQPTTTTKNHYSFNQIPHPKQPNGEIKDENCFFDIPDMCVYVYKRNKLVTALIRHYQQKKM
jgi:hypothetical protein